MLYRQEQMPHRKRKGLYEIKFIEFSRTGFLMRNQVCSSSAVPPCWDTQFWDHGSPWAPLQSAVTGVRQTWPPKTSAGPENYGRLLRGRNVFSQAFSERLLSLLSGTSPFPFIVGKASLSIGCHPLFSQVVLLVPFNDQ